jgi:hypothetical protein
MTEDELVEFIGGLDGVEVLVAGPDNGAPEAAWGDVFSTVAGQRIYAAPGELVVAAHARER